jgi:hypothetical protein
MWILAYVLVGIDDFLKVPGLRFCGHVPNSHRNKNLKRYISNLFEKMVFWTPKDCCPPSVGAKETFSSSLNVTILQMIRNESVRFGRYIDIEVSYKILQLEVSKLVPILHYPACFQKELFAGSFEQKHPSSFRGQTLKFLVFFLPHSTVFHKIAKVNFSKN